MNLDQFDMKKQYKIEVLLAIAPVLRNRWIQPPPTSVEQLANIKVDDDVKLVRDGGLLANNHPYAHSTLENLMDLFCLLLR